MVGGRVVSVLCAESAAAGFSAFFDFLAGEPLAVLVLVVAIQSAKSFSAVGLGLTAGCSCRLARVGGSWAVPDICRLGIRGFRSRC